MKKNFYFVMAAVAAMSMASCSQDEMPSVNEIAKQDAGPVELGVSQIGLEKATTRSGISGTAFSGTESVGVFIFDSSISSGAAQSADNYLKGSVTTPTLNVKYQRTQHGAEPPYTYSWDAADPIILSTTVGKVYAYYPWTTGYTDATAIPVSVAADQGTGQSDGTADANGQTDFMWASVVNGGNSVNAFSNASGDINHQAKLTMNHALAMISFTFQQATGADGANALYPGLGQVSSIVLKNKASNTQHVIKTGGSTMDINDGSLALTRAAANDANTITVAPTSGRDTNGSNMVENGTVVGTGNMADGSTAYTQDKQARVLVYPFVDTTNGLLANEVQAVITIDGSVYTIDLPAITPDGVNEWKNGWVPGNNYLYTFTLKGTALEVTSVTITDWIQQAGGSGDIKTPDPIVP